MDDIDSIRDRLWNPDIDARSYDASSQAYRAAILEQYKIFVEMADRVSARRGAANTFFLTLNTAVATAVCAFAKETVRLPPVSLALVFIILLCQCVTWWWLIRSYRLLNGAKYKVIGMLEERLPASPYWRAEWTALGEGKDWRKYAPLSHIEQSVPVVFAGVYIAAYVFLGYACMIF